MQLPEGGATRLYLLAAADGDQRASFQVGDRAVDLTIQDWGGFIGQWDNRIWKAREEPVPPRAGQAGPPPGTPPRMRTVMDFSGLTPGFVKKAPVAWFASHRHGPDGANEPYAYAYLFVYSIDVPAGVKTITLPVNERVRILAMSVTNETGRVQAASALYDSMAR